MIRRACLGSLLALVVSAGSGFAQADRDTLLPDLAPREMEILGNLEITFPSMRRQPLTGFNPPPRIYEVPRGRLPWMNEYKQATADLPGTSLIQPVSPPATISVGQHPHNGEISMGIGRHLSREVRAQATIDVGSHVVFFGDAFHDGLSRYLPFDDSLGIEGRHQNYDGLAGLTYRVGAVSSGVEVSGFFEELDLYGVAPSPGTTAAPVRDGQGFGGKVWVNTGATSKIPIRVDASYRSNTYETDADSLAQPVSIDGSLLELEGNSRFDVGALPLTIDGKVWLSSQVGYPDVTENLLDVNEPTNDLTTYRGGGEIVLETGEKGVLRIGAQVQGYSSSRSRIQVVGDQSPIVESKFFVAPRISYLNLIASGTEVYVKNTPIVRAHDQEGLFGVNPFLVDGALALPELSIVNVEGGLVLYKGPARLAMRTGITSYENFLYFVSSTSSVFGEGLFDTRYGTADVIFGGADIGISFPGQFSATLTGTWQSAKLKNDQDVPNYPGFEGGVRASYVFAGDRALLQVDGKFVGERNVDSSGEDVVAGYTDLAFLASYYLENGVGFFARIQSMTGQSFERWVGYPVADWVTLGGIRLRW